MRPSSERATCCKRSGSVVCSSRWQSGPLSVVGSPLLKLWNSVREMVMTYIAHPRAGSHRFVLSLGATVKTRLHSLRILDSLTSEVSDYARDYHPKDRDSGSQELEGKLRATAENSQS